MTVRDRWVPRGRPTVNDVLGQRVIHLRREVHKWLEGQGFVYSLRITPANAEILLEASQDVLLLFKLAWGGA